MFANFYGINTPTMAKVQTALELERDACNWLSLASKIQLQHTTETDSSGYKIIRVIAS